MEIKGKVHCFFEQSGTFKKEFIKLGISAEDYDIQNNFGQTDNVIDLFSEINKGYKDEPSIFDNITKDFDFESVSKELIRVCKFVNIVMFCSKQQVSRTMMFFENLGYMVNLLVWDKTNPAPLGNNKLVNNLEYIVVARESGAYFNNALPINKKRMSFYYATGVKNFHPCEKPINLICDLLNLFSKKDDTVLDCFSGSGTTAIACKRTKRNFICVEKNEEYYKISCERLATEQVKKRLF